MVSLRGQCSLGAFNKRSGRCPDKEYLSDHLGCIYWKSLWDRKQNKTVSCLYEYHCTELTPNTRKSRKDNTEEKNGLCLSLQSPCKFYTYLMIKTKA